jgi:hypothetical protein
MGGGYGLAKARGKGGDAALTGHIVSDKGNDKNRIIH